MGQPILESQDFPENFLQLEAGGQKLSCTCVSMGNPHCVIFTDVITDDQVLKLGPEIENHALFPSRINVEFARIDSPEEITMRVWERGSGETLACGTGACATHVAAVLNKKCGPKTTLHLLGGDLEIEWESGGPVFMTGPAETVFEGTYTLILNE